MTPEELFTAAPDWVGNGEWSNPALRENRNAWNRDGSTCQGNISNARSAKLCLEFTAPSEDGKTEDAGGRFFQYRCEPVATVPRPWCRTDGVHQVPVRWAREGSGSRARYSSTRLWRVLMHYVKQASRREERLACRPQGAPPILQLQREGSGLKGSMWACVATFGISVRSGKHNVNRDSQRYHPARKKKNDSGGIYTTSEPML
jgi:hypothetical protein